MIRSLMNLIWFIFGGIIMGLAWWLWGLLMYILIITIPWGKSCFVFGKFCFFPFGHEMISREDLTGEKDIGTGLLGLLGTIIWLLVGGWALAVGHIVCGILCFATIIGIPFGVQHLKLALAALMPIGKTVVKKKDIVNYQKRDKAKLKKDVVVEKPQIETEVIVEKPKQDSDSIENKLEKLEDLKTKGIVTEEEYEEKKKEIIDKF